MTKKNKEGSLSNEEKAVVKALLARGERNQDIQALINLGRKHTINSARITEVKQNNQIIPAENELVEFFKIKKNSFDLKTGLNFFDDERLIRAREAMLLAVQVFNSPALLFKSGVFAILANIAWTYLLHEYYERKGVKIVNDDNRTLLLSQMLTRRDCPLSSPVIKNLEDVKKIRDDVEHILLGKADKKWLPLFQACCLNFEKSICLFFGDKLSLSKELSIALQFSKLNFEQITTLNKYEIPSEIEALDASILSNKTPDDLANIEYQFKVLFTMSASSKSQSHIQFLNPKSAEDKEIQNVLIKYTDTDEIYKFRPLDVRNSVGNALKLPKGLTGAMHTNAWKFYKVRPTNNCKDPNKTNRQYCKYYATHKQYSYTQEWINFLILELADDVKWEQIRKFR